MIENGETIENTKEITNVLNDFFGNIGQKLSEKIDKPMDKTLYLP